MYTALAKLGYRSYHCVEMGSAEGRKNLHTMSWYEGMMWKVYGRGKPFGKSEFDKLLGNYSVGVRISLPEIWSFLVVESQLWDSQL